MPVSESSSSPRTASVGSGTSDVSGSEARAENCLQIQFNSFSSSDKLPTYLLPQAENKSAPFSSNTSPCCPGVLRNERTAFFRIFFRLICLRHAWCHETAALLQPRQWAAVTACHRCSCCCCFSICLQSRRDDRRLPPLPASHRHESTNLLPAAATIPIFSPTTLVHIHGLHTDYC